MATLRKAKAARHGALAALLVMGGFAIAGPSGLLAWSENLRLLDQRQAQLARIEKERKALANRVALLNRDHADPDMVGELLRSQLNVVHPDEVVVKLDD
ncbi:MAG: septum formation initiator family protein [Erythrobacter sp.]